MVYPLRRSEGAVIFGLLTHQLHPRRQYMRGASAPISSWPSSASATGGARDTPLAVGIIGNGHRAADAREAVQIVTVRIVSAFGLRLSSRGCSATNMAFRNSLCDATGALRRTQPRLHVPAELPRVVISRRSSLPCDVVRDREDPARRVPAAATENPQLVQAFRHQRAEISRSPTVSGVALAAFAGVMAAPILPSHPLMERNLIIVVFRWS